MAETSTASFDSALVPTVTSGITTGGGVLQGITTGGGVLAMLVDDMATDEPIFEPSSGSNVGVGSSMGGVRGTYSALGTSLLVISHQIPEYLV